MIKRLNLKCFLRGAGQVTVLTPTGTHVSEDYRSEITGQIFGLIFALAGLCAGSWLSINGSPWLGPVVAVAPLGMLVAAFLYSHISEERRGGEQH